MNRVVVFIFEALKRTVLFAHRAMISCIGKQPQIVAERDVTDA